MTPTEEIPPGTTAAGSCHLCGTWSEEALVVAEIPSNSGAGATVVRCSGACPRPRPPVAHEPRRYPQ